MDPVTIAAALGPLALDIFRTLKDKFLPGGDYKPDTMAEWLQMRQLELEQFKAMQDQGPPTGVLWADVFIRLQKPALATLAFMLFGYQETFMPGGATQNVTNIASAFGFWMLGEAGKTAFQSMKASRGVK